MKLLDGDGENVDMAQSCVTKSKRRPMLKKILNMDKVHNG